MPFLSCTLCQPCWAVCFPDTLHAPGAMGFSDGAFCWKTYAELKICTGLPPSQPVHPSHMSSPHGAEVPCHLSSSHSPRASCQHSTAELPANDAIVLRVQHGRHFKLNRCDSKTTRSIIFYLINLKLSLSSYLIARRYHAGEVEHILGMLPYLIFFRAVITLKITLRVYFNN